MAKAHPIPTDPRFKDLSGRRFGKWLVLAWDGKHPGGSKWKCRCDCGREASVMGCSLNCGTSTQCRKCSYGASGRIRKHGGDGTAEYMAYKNMLERCRNPKTPMFNHYGGRGITVCERWMASFANFLADMGPRPSDAHSIDRINNDGNYEPTNCRWATQDIQCRNNSRTRMLSHNGITMPAIDWAAHLGISYKTLCERLARGWTTERALSQPIQKHVRSAAQSS